MIKKTTQRKPVPQVILYKCDFRSLRDGYRLDAWDDIVQSLTREQRQELSSTGRADVLVRFVIGGDRPM